MDNNMLVYLKVEKNNEVQSKKIAVKDIAKLYGVNKRLITELNQLIILEITSNKNCKFMFSILKVIERMNEVYPEVVINVVGESDFIVDYKKPKKSHVIFDYIKTAVVALTVFFGSAFSIMTFNEDVSVTKVFGLIYELIMGQEKSSGSILEISYSIGLFLGIVLFFNHFSKWKLHDDPTPIQIQMRLYESDVNDTLIENASREGKSIDSN